MGSVRCTVPIPTSTTLEAKVDDVGRKLDELLSRGGCPVCGTCSQHTGQQEAMASLLSAQSRLLDSLERKVLEVQTALEGLARGLEEVHPQSPFEKVFIPMEVLQRRKSLPMRALVDEVYVQLDTDGDQIITQRVLNTAPIEGETGMLEELGEGEGKRAAEQRTKVDPPQVRVKPEAGVQHQCETEEGRGAMMSALSVPPNAMTRVTVMEDVTLLPPSHKPPKTMGLAVPMMTGEGSSLRHAHSCPDSLHRLQDPGPKPDPVYAVAPPLVKTCTAGAVAGAVASNQLTASGIQIRVSPAVDRNTTRTRTPPKPCHKVIDDVPPQPAPFPHRVVSMRSSPLCDAFSVHTTEVLGGGRFGKVLKCTDNTSGLRLAAKIINTRNSKEKEMATNEIQVMNQLSHANILQLYDAFEVKNQVVLVVEYVEGGELFERIVDESSPLTEVDAMVFLKQICEGVQYMHQMYVLHLDLKPENILCVNRTSHQVKIIDFGLARRYKPREKLRVSFGTPEFLSPEVVNFDFVSFPTDMWTLGVVTYMLLSGLSPFLGDDDSQTLNNVVMLNWYFEEDAFEHISNEARDFISNLLIRERSGRLSAAGCLKHPWLNNISEKAKRSNIVLKSQVLLKKYMARRIWKKNYIAIAAANRFKKMGSSGSFNTLGI